MEELSPLTFFFKIIYRCHIRSEISPELDNMHIPKKSKNCIHKIAWECLEGSSVIEHAVKSVNVIGAKYKHMKTFYIPLQTHMHQLNL